MTKPIPFGLRSITGDHQYELTVVNETDTLLHVFWVDYHGKETFNGQLPAHKRMKSNTFVTHPWIFRNANTGKLVSWFNKEDANTLAHVLYINEEAQQQQGTSKCVETEEESSCNEILSKYARSGWKNRAFASNPIPELVQHLKSQQKYFVDAEMPASGFEDRRLFYLLYHKSISPMQVKQGRFGVCWLLQSLCGAARFAEQLESIFDVSGEKYGLYGVHLYYQDKRVTVIVDNFFPFKGNEPQCAETVTPGQIWVFAKLSGGYDFVDGTKTIFSPSKALCAMLGGTEKCMDWRHECYWKMVQDGSFWQLMQQAWNNGSILVCTSRDTSEKISPEQLVTYHGYTILDMRYFAKHDLHLMCIRNTWAKTEWNGAWGDESKEWNMYPDIAKELHWKKGNDGAFWMSRKDFEQFFCVMWWNEKKL